MNYLANLPRPRSMANPPKAPSKSRFGSAWNNLLNLFPANPDYSQFRQKGGRSMWVGGTEYIYMGDGGRGYSYAVPIK